MNPKSGLCSVCKKETTCNDWARLKKKYPLAFENKEWMKRAQRHKKSWTCESCLKELSLSLS